MKQRMSARISCPRHIADSQWLSMILPSIRASKSSNLTAWTVSASDSSSQHGLIFLCRRSRGKNLSSGLFSDLGLVSVHQSDSVLGVIGVMGTGGATDVKGEMGSSSVVMWNGSSVRYPISMKHLVGMYHVSSKADGSLTRGDWGLFW